MSVLNYLVFVTGFFHLNLKDHVEFDDLESTWNILSILYCVECNMDMLHFFRDHVLSKGRAHGMVRFQDIVHQLGRGRPNCVFF